LVDSSLRFVANGETTTNGGGGRREAERAREKESKAERGKERAVVLPFLRFN